MWQIFFVCHHHHLLLLLLSTFLVCVFLEKKWNKNGLHSSIYLYYGIDFGIYRTVLELLLLLLLLFLCQTRYLFPALFLSRSHTHTHSLLFCSRQCMFMLFIFAWWLVGCWQYVETGRMSISFYGKKCKKCTLCN